MFRIEETARVLWPNKYSRLKRNSALVASILAIAIALVRRLVDFRGVPEQTWIYLSSNPDSILTFLTLKIAPWFESFVGLAIVLFLWSLNFPRIYAKLFRYFFLVVTIVLTVDVSYKTYLSYYDFGFFADHNLWPFPGLSFDMRSNELRQLTPTYRIKNIQTASPLQTLKILFPDIADPVLKLAPSVKNSPPRILSLKEKAEYKNKAMTTTLRKIDGCFSHGCEIDPVKLLNLTTTKFALSNSCKISDIHLLSRPELQEPDLSNDKSINEYLEHTFLNLRISFAASCVQEKNVLPGTKHQFYIVYDCPYVDSEKDGLHKCAVTTTKERSILSNSNYSLGSINIHNFNEGDSAAKGREFHQASCATGAGEALKVKWNPEPEMGGELGHLERGPCQDSSLYQISVNFGPLIEQDHACSKGGSISHTLVDFTNIEEETSCEGESEEDWSKLTFAYNSTTSKLVFFQHSFSSEKNFREDELKERFKSAVRATLQHAERLVGKNLTAELDLTTPKIRELYPDSEISYNGIKLSLRGYPMVLDESLKSLPREAGYEVFFRQQDQSGLILKKDNFYYSYSSTDLKKKIPNYVFRGFEDIIPAQVLSVNDSLYVHKDSHHRNLTELYKKYSEYIAEFNRLLSDRIKECNSDDDCINKLPAAQKLISYQEFIDFRPIVLWRDPLGRYQRFLREVIIPPYLEEPLLYIYGKIGQRFQVTIKYPVQVQVSEPFYINHWSIEIGQQQKLIDLNTGKEHSSLFWEGQSLLLEEPTHGWLLESKTIREELQLILIRLGFNEKEQWDFLKYWVPRLKKSKFYKVFLVDQKIIDHMAPVEIYPAPKKFLRFHFLFKEETDDSQRPIKPTQQDFFRDETFALEWSGFVYK